MGRSQHDMDDTQRGTHAVLHERYTAHGRKVLKASRKTGLWEPLEQCQAEHSPEEGGAGNALA